MASITRYQFALAGALKAGARNHVEYAVRPVTGFRGEAAALHFKIINVLGIKLRPYVGSNVCIRNRDSVNGPRHLVSAAHMQLVMHHGCARNKIGDHGHGVGAVRSGRLGNIIPAHQRLRSC